MTDGNPLSPAIVYLKQPQITSAFRVSVVRRGANDAEIVGEDVDSLTKFVFASGGLPQFDLEFDCRQYCRCVATSERSGRPFAFTFANVVELGELAAEPSTEKQ